MKTQNKPQSKIEEKSRKPHESVPFRDAEEAWFWFILAQQARNDGARFVSGLGLFPRPCEPSDIMKILDRLYRNRLLIMDHLLVLRHYGRRQLRPDPRRVKEIKAAKLWMEAFDRLTPVLARKGIIEEKRPHESAGAHWARQAVIYENLNHDTINKERVMA